MTAPWQRPVQLLRSSQAWAFALPPLLLWALALWPDRSAMAVAVEAALAGASVIGSRAVFERGLAALIFASRATPDLVATAAAGIGIALSTLSLSLAAVGRLPRSLEDPRGGAAVLWAASASILALRAWTVSANTTKTGATDCAEAREAPAAWLSLAAGFALGGSMSVTACLASGSLLALAAGVMAGIAAVSLGAIQSVAVGKTPPTFFLERCGVLTEGRPKVVRVESIDASTSREEILHWAAAIENPVRHPIRNAIVEACGAGSKTLPQVKHLHPVPTRGVQATFQRKKAHLGNARLFESAGWPPERIDEIRQWTEELSRQGETVVFLGVEGVLRGAICLVDPLRADATECLAEIDRCGARVHVLSGDDPISVKAQLSASPHVEIHAGVDAREADRIVDAAQRSQGKIWRLIAGNISEAKTDAAGSGTSEPPLQAAVRLARGAAAEARAARRRTWALVLYHAAGIPLLAGAFEPWIGVPPLPFGAALAAAALPLGLSFISPSRFAYNRPFAIAPTEASATP